MTYYSRPLLLQPPFLTTAPTRAIVSRAPYLNTLRHLALSPASPGSRFSGFLPDLKAKKLRVWAREIWVNCATHGESSDTSDKDGKSARNNTKDGGNWLLWLLIVAVVLAACTTASSLFLSNHYRWSGKHLIGGNKEAEIGVYFQLKLFGTNYSISQECPGWVYFWLLMAAGFGLFVSEEALNVWVGSTIARSLVLDGAGVDLVASIGRNAGYIVSTFFWIYWGVCISDMIPFYIGKYAAQTKAGDDLCKKVGVGEKKLGSIRAVVQRYGNLIGFVERFSLGVRNPTSFLAGAMGVTPKKFFMGVCLGALITVPLQLGVGFLFWERPLVGLAGVAAVVGAWTVLPYGAAFIASIAYMVRKKLES